MNLHLLLVPLVLALSACAATPSLDAQALARPSAPPAQACAPAAQNQVHTEATGAAPATWSDDDIRASHTTRDSTEPDSTARHSTKPGRTSAADRTPQTNLLAVFEAGGCQLTLLDAERWEVVKRFPLKAALLPNPQASPNGRYLYVGTQSGWVTQYDLHRMEVAAQVRVGFALRHLALSSDGRFLAAANDAPKTLVLLSADFQPIKQIDIGTLDGKHSSRIAALRNAPPRQSFVAALADVAEVWEIAYDERAAPIFDGYVHDYRMGEGIAKPGFLNPRRTPLEQPLDDFVFDAGHHNIVGTVALPVAASSTTTVQVTNLDVRRRIAQFAVPGRPQLSGGTRFMQNGRAIFASPNLTRAAIDLFDLRSWKLVASIAAPGPSTYVGTDVQSPYLWATAASPEDTGNTLTLIDKHTLQSATTLHEAGHRLGDVQFSADGHWATVLAGGKNGALIVLDARTQREVRRVAVQDARWSLPLPAQRARP